MNAGHEWQRWDKKLIDCVVVAMVSNIVAVACSVVAATIVVVIILLKTFPEEGHLTQLDCVACSVALACVVVHSSCLVIQNTYQRR